MVYSEFLKASSTRFRHFYGLLLLIIVNILWVSGAEITRYIFVDLNFRRPFFVSSIRLSMLAVYIIRYLLFKSSSITNKTLEKSSCIEKKETNVELLTPAEFEQISVSEESDVEKSFRLPRRVHFSQLREIRHMPLSIADEAKQARLPYSGAQYLCEYLPRSFKYIFLLSIMWIISSLTYQGSLLFSNVSTVNLISASSSLFVLVLSVVCFVTASDKFTLTKLFLVMFNLFGVFLVTEYSISTYGALLALLSSFLYALYLVMFSYFQYQGLDIDINFLLGFVGVITLFLYAPVMLSLDYFKIEPLFPLPNFYQFSIIILNGVNNLFSDFLWLKGTIWTSSLASSISLSMCIPLSFIADTLLRSQPPNVIQLVATFPITVSFLGVAFLQSNSDHLKHNDTIKMKNEECLSLIEENNFDDGDEL